MCLQLLYDRKHNIVNLSQIKMRTAYVHRKCWDFHIERRDYKGTHEP